MDLKGDQVDVHVFTVKNLIDFVWTLNEDSETIVVRLKWLDKTRFDILGKVLVDTGGTARKEILRLIRTNFKSLCENSSRIVLKCRLTLRNGRQQHITSWQFDPNSRWQIPRAEHGA